MAHEKQSQIAFQQGVIQMVLEKLDIYKEKHNKTKTNKIPKLNLNLNLTFSTKINSNWIRDLNVRYKTKMLLEKEKKHNRRKSLGSRV